MKCTAEIDIDNQLYVTIEAETAAEAGRLVQLGMARNANTDKVSQFTVGDKVQVFVTLRPRQQSDGKFIAPYYVPKNLTF
jgi:hypothetical protein